MSTKKIKYRINSDNGKPIERTIEVGYYAGELEIQEEVAWDILTSLSVDIFDEPDVNSDEWPLIVSMEPSDDETRLEISREVSK